MNKKYFKSCIALVLAFTILCCGAVSVSAYNPIVTIKSSDWNCEEGATAYDYPDKILIGDDEDAFRQYTELYGDTCYFSSADDMVTLNSVDVEINPDDYKYDGLYFFERNNRFYLVNFNPDAVLMCLDSVGCLSFYPVHGDDEKAENQTTTLTIYYSNYPYNAFSVGSIYTFSSDPVDGEYDMGQWFQYFSANRLYPAYSTVDVYERDDIDIGGVVYDADEPITDTFTLNVELSNPYKIYTGIASFSLTATQIQQFSLGRYAFLFNNLGFINGYDSLYDGVYFQMNIYNDDHSVYESFPLLDKVLWDAVGMTGQTSTLPAYSCSIDDYVIFWENDFNDLDTGVYNCVIAFVFVSDVFSAFFPGTVEIVEFENYEDDMEHEDVLKAVGEASSIISGEISSASSELSSEIAEAATDIKDAINESSVEIVSSMYEVKDEIKNGVEDVTGALEDVKKGITNKMTEIKDSLLEGIKSFFIPSDEVMEEIDDKWDELLKTRFGALYEVSGIITDFASEMSWDFVEQAGEKNTIIMPSVTVKLVDTDFTFGGYEVKVVPDGFDVLTTALKGITSIVCTLLFVNALRRKYDKLVGGGSA